MAIRVGDRAPSFTLHDQHGAPFVLAEALNNGPVVLFFYPKDESMGCTMQACSFRDAHQDFADMGAQVVGISSDDEASHRRFAENHRLGYRLLADVGGTVRGSFGVRRGLFGLADGRVTYVIDRSGVVRHVFDSMIQTGRHVEEALATVKGLAAA